MLQPTYMRRRFLVRASLSTIGSSALVLGLLLGLSGGGPAGAAKATVQCAPSALTKATKPVTIVFWESMSQAERDRAEQPHQCVQLDAARSQCDAGPAGWLGRHLGEVPGRPQQRPVAGPWRNSKTPTCREPSTRTRSCRSRPASTRPTTPRRITSPRFSLIGRSMDVQWASAVRGVESDPLLQQTRLHEGGPQPGPSRRRRSPR